jgi:hypothetical protein
MSEPRWIHPAWLPTPPTPFRQPDRNYKGLATTSVRIGERLAFVADTSGARRALIGISKLPEVRLYLPGSSIGSNSKLSTASIIQPEMPGAWASCTAAKAASTGPTHAAESGRGGA